MRNLGCVLLSALMLLNGYAWGGESDATTTNIKVKKAKKCLFNKSKKRAPSWVCNAQVDGLAVAAVGSATRSKAGLAFMEQMAVADARSRLVQNLQKSATSASAVGEDAPNKNTADRDSTTPISDELLVNTKIIKRVYGPHGTLYVLIGIDEAGAQKLRDAVGASDLDKKQ
jgi:hypothetical protein